MNTGPVTQGKGASRGRASLRRRLLPVLVAGCFTTGAATANPTGFNRISGEATWSEQGNVLTVTNSSGAIIDWKSFSIGLGETVEFIQSADSSVLNRVTGVNPSEILGTLKSDGRVFLINPNGIVFGEGAIVNVNGLVASTLYISEQDFEAGRMKFEGGGLGNVTNKGKITTPDGGQVYLIAPNVENASTGVITAPNGDVILAAGHSVDLVDSTNPALHVVVSAPENEALNVGEIVVQGGQASVYGALVRQRGTVSANSAVVGENGKIYFRASHEITLDAGSVTSANGANGGSVHLLSDDMTVVKGTVEARGEEGKGGSIHLLGDKVAVMDAALVDASGKTGGGEVLVGGDYLGQGSVPNAQITYTGEQAIIRADATGNGNGGRVIVWSDDTTRSYAHISVRGGAEGGDGGFVETSGKRFLDVGHAFPDVSAAKGKAGTWLLDPDEITIDATTDNNITFSSPFTPASTGTSVLNVTTLVNFLQTNGSAVVQTSGNITDGNITVAAAINPNLPSGGQLELRAHGDIIVDQAIGVTGGALDLALRADIEGSGVGGVIVRNQIDTNNGDLLLKGAQVQLDAGAIVSAGTSGRVDVEVHKAGGLIQTNGSSSITAHALRMRADDMDLAGAITVLGDQGSGGGTFLNTYSAGRAIHLGADTAGTLGLNATELQSIDSPYLMIGDPGNTGGISVKGPVSFAGDRVGTLWLASSGPISIESSLTKMSGGSNTQIDLHSNGNGIILQSGGSISGWDFNVFNSGTDGYMALNSSSSITAATGGNVDFRVDSLTLNGTVSAAGVDFRPYTSGRGITVGSATCHSSTPQCLTLTNLSQVSAPTIGIGHHDDSGGTFSSSVGAIYVAGITSATGNLATDRNASTTRIGLLSGGNVTQGGAIQVTELGVISGGSALLDHSGNLVGGLIGETNGGSFTFRNSQALTVTTITEGGDTYDGIWTRGGNVSLATTAGGLTVDYDINAGSGNVSLNAAGAVTGGYVWGNHLAVHAGDGINLLTEVRSLSAVNADTAGSSGISIGNYEALDLMEVRQAGNAGFISVYASGEVPGTSHLRVQGVVDAAGGFVDLDADGSLSGTGVVKGGQLHAYAYHGISLNTEVGSLVAMNYDTGASDINITNKGTLVLDYLEQTGSGNISVTNYGAMSVGAYVDPLAQTVVTTSGSVGLTANSPLTVNGLVESGTGSIRLIASPSAAGNDNLVVDGAVKTAGSIALAAGGTVTINGTVTGGQISIQEYLGTTGGTVDSAIKTVTSTMNTTTTSISDTTNTSMDTSTSSTSSTDESSDSSSSESDEATEETSEATAANETGASENEPASKMYCN